MQAMKKFLACSLLLTLSSAWAEDFSAAAGVVGLLEVPPLSCAYQDRPIRYRPVVLFKKPVAAKPIGEIRAAPDPGAGLGPCEAGATRLYRPSAGGELTPERLPTLEWAYEEPGLIVVSRRGPWFKVVIPGGFAWLRMRPEMVFRSVPTLLQGAYAFSTEGRGLLRLYYEAGSKDQFVDTPVKESAPLVVQAAQHVDGRLWLKVGILPQAALDVVDRGICDDPHRVHALLAVGWLPFHSHHGQPRAWFYSRGC